MRLLISSIKQKSLKLFFNFSPILKFRILEESMIPNFKPGDIVLVERISILFRTPKIDDLIIFSTPPQDNKFLIKRIRKIYDRRYFVMGENLKHSVDSRHFGWIEKSSIIGRVFFVKFLS